jgi:hypothetical protein
MMFSACLTAPWLAELCSPPHEEHARMGVMANRSKALMIWYIVLAP